MSLLVTNLFLPSFVPGAWPREKWEAASRGGEQTPSPSHSPGSLSPLPQNPHSFPPRMGPSSNTPGSLWVQGRCPSGSAHENPRFVPNLGALLPSPKSKQLGSICVTFGGCPHPPPNVGTTAGRALVERGIRPIVQKMMPPTELVRF